MRACVPAHGPRSSGALTDSYSPASSRVRDSNPLPPGTECNGDDGDRGRGLRGAEGGGIGARRCDFVSGIAVDDSESDPAHGNRILATRAYLCCPTGAKIRHPHAPMPPFSRAFPASSLRPEAAEPPLLDEAFNMQLPWCPAFLIVASGVRFFGVRLITNSLLLVSQEISKSDSQSTQR